MRKILTFILSLAFSLPAFSGDYEDAEKAWERKDYRLAFEKFKLAASQDIPMASMANIRLGNIYDAGLGVPQDFTEAIRYYKIAAKQGNPLGFLFVAAMYENGQGVEKNLAEAEKWKEFARQVDGDFNANYVLTCAKSKISYEKEYEKYKNDYGTFTVNIDGKGRAIVWNNGKQHASFVETTYYTLYNQTGGKTSLKMERMGSIVKFNLITKNFAGQLENRVLMIDESTWTYTSRTDEAPRSQMGECWQSKP